MMEDMGKTLHRRLISQLLADDDVTGRRRLVASFVGRDDSEGVFAGLGGVKDGSTRAAKAVEPPRGSLPEYTD
jgi:hypothetical protein